MQNIKHHSFFIFEDEHQNERDYDLYIFNDFSYAQDSIQEKIFNVFDDIRKIVHRPERIIVICLDTSRLDIKKLNGRISNNKKNINYIDYQKISKDIFEKGISEIVKKNKVVQYAPTGTIFKKTSGKEQSYFIKTSLALLEYSQTCFLALALYEQIKDELPQKIYIDVASISPLIQATIHYYNLTLTESTYSPEIINFRSYDNINSHQSFNNEGSYTVMSASTSGGLREERGIDESKCITIFYPKKEERNNKEKNTERCLFEIKDIKLNKIKGNLKPIPLTSEDFSLEHAESKEVIITEENIRVLDGNRAPRINKILENLSKLDISNVPNEFKGNQKHPYFNSKEILQLLKKNEFIKIFDSIITKKSNYIICDEFPNLEIEKDDIKITKADFLKGDSNFKDKNIIVFLTQSNSNDLIRISSLLRKYSVTHITYVIGVLWTDDIQHSKNLRNNICYNDTPYNYSFYCYLDLPLYSANPYPDEIKKYKDKLSDGFVFYRSNNQRSSTLKNTQVYLVICFILELLRGNKELNDDISYHDVISPENFYRFNDSLLQLSILMAARGRELNFQSNNYLSQQMKKFILNLKKEKNYIGDIFINELKNEKIKLTNSDEDEIHNKYPELFEKEL